MRCAGCPLYKSWSNESDSGESCGLFGDAWDSPFQYEDKDGTIIGCYVDRHFIERNNREFMNFLKEKNDMYEELMIDELLYG